MTMRIGEAFDINPKVPIKKQQVVPFVSMSNIEPWKRDVKSSSMKAYNGGSRFQDGDILLARITPCLENGKTSIYRSDPECQGMPAAGSTEFIVIRGKNGISSTDFGYYFFRAEQVRKCIIGLMSGSSGRQRIQIDAFLEHKITLPPLETQKAIAAVLGILDEKIELNQRCANLLENIAVQEFLKLEHAPVQQRIKLDELLRVFIGKTPPRKEKKWFTLDLEHALPWVSIKDMGRLGLFIDDTSERLTDEAIKKHNIQVVDPWDVLVSFKLTVGRVSLAPEKLVTNEAIACLHTDDESLREYVYAYMKTFNYSSLGSTSSIATAINSKIIKAVEIKLPSQEVIEKYHSLANPMFQKILSLQKESKALARLRDALLPELMSGRIRVPEAREAIEQEVG